MVDRVSLFNYSLLNKDFGYLQDKCMEEMTELMKEFFKNRERGDTEFISQNIIEEFADVQLMLDQLRFIYDKRTNNEFSGLVKQSEQHKCDKLWRVWNG